MKEYMEQIIQQQQEYEYLKKSDSFHRLSNNAFTSSFTKQKILPCLTNCAKKRKEKVCLNYIAVFFFSLLILYFAISFLGLFVYLLST